MQEPYFETRVDPDLLTEIAAAPPEQPPRVVRFREFLWLASIGKFKGVGKYFQVVGHYVFFGVLSSGAVRLARGRCPEVIYALPPEVFIQYVEKNPWLVETELEMSGDELEVGEQVQ